MFDKYNATRNICFLFSSYPYLLPRAEGELMLSRNPALKKDMLFGKCLLGWIWAAPSFFLSPLCDKVKQLPEVKCIAWCQWAEDYVYVLLLWFWTSQFRTLKWENAMEHLAIPAKSMAKVWFGKTIETLCHSYIQVFKSSNKTICLVLWWFNEIKYIKCWDQVCV